MLRDPRGTSIPKRTFQIQIYGHVWFGVVQGFEKAYFLAKVRRMVDGVYAVRNISGATLARTRGVAKRRKIEASPSWLQSRMEKDDKLPDVEIDGEEVLGEVVRFVVHQLKADLVCRFYTP